MCTVILIKRISITKVRRPSRRFLHVLAVVTLPTHPYSYAYIYAGPTETDVFLEKTIKRRKNQPFNI